MNYEFITDLPIHLSENNIKDLHTEFKTLIRFKRTKNGVYIHVLHPGIILKISEFLHINQILWKPYKSPL